MQIMGHGRGFGGEMEEKDATERMTPFARPPLFGNGGTSISVFPSLRTVRPTFGRPSSRLVNGCRNRVKSR
jgi:hypothetical protein